MCEHLTLNLYGISVGSLLSVPPLHFEEELNTNYQQFYFSFVWTDSIIKLFYQT